MSAAPCPGARAGGGASRCGTAAISRLRLAACRVAADSCSSSSSGCSGMTTVRSLRCAMTVGAAGCTAASLSPEAFNVERRELHGAHGGARLEGAAPQNARRGTASLRRDRAGAWRRAACRASTFQAGSPCRAPACGRARTPTRERARRRPAMRTPPLRRARRRRATARSCGNLRAAGAQGWSGCRLPASRRRRRAVGPVCRPALARASAMRSVRRRRNRSRQSGGAAPAAAAAAAAVAASPLVPSRVPGHDPRRSRRRRFERERSAAARRRRGARPRDERARLLPPPSVLRAGAADRGRGHRAH